METLGIIEMDTAAWAALGTVAAGLSTAITAVWKFLNQKLNDCESKHSTQTEQLILVSNRVARLEGFNEGLQKHSDDDTGLS